MKLAFHFDADHPSLSTRYGHDIEKLLFSILLQHRNPNISSKVLVGDLVLEFLASELEGNILRFNPNKYPEVINIWLRPKHTVWSSMIYDRLQDVLNKNVFTVCFETIEMQLADYMDDKLHVSSEAYLGALEVDDASYAHWFLYSNAIGPMYRVINKTVTIFWDGFSAEYKDEGLVEWLSKLGFESVAYESLNGRYTIFDEYHDFEHARRIAEWKKQCGNFLAFIADDVAHRLGDTAPDLSDKLWAMFKTFNEAETNEQFAQVAASCRRIVEYVSDQLFPPIESEIGGHKLGTQQYRNRLLAFVNTARKSDTNIDNVWVSTKTLGEQIERLSELVNKGIHSEVYRSETRRCLLRTIMLLDDIISLKTGAFEIRAKLNFDIL